MHRFLLVSLACFLPLTLFAENPRTMRVDYYHSGNNEAEIFSLDRVVLEPLAFPGNLAQPIDQTLRGKYAFEIVDPKTGDIAWSRSFSSIYGEWETTGEARKMNRTFHESLRFPRPDSEFDIVIKKRNQQNGFEEIWRTTLDPDDFLVHQESAAFASQVVAIEHNGDPATKVDVLLLGDGYTPAEQEQFIQKAKELSRRLRNGGMILISGHWHRPQNNPACRDHLPAFIATLPLARATMHFAVSAMCSPMPTMTGVVSHHRSHTIS
jgi:hypothetical protein